VTVMRYNGGGGSHFRRGSVGAVVGSDEGGCSDHFGSGRRGIERWHLCTRERWRRPFGLGRKTIGWGPCVGERGRGWLAGPTKDRGLVAGGSGGPM
jgi:hypothetical protein